MRRFVLPAFLLAAAPLAQAQTTFGLTAGLNVANVSFDDEDGGLTESKEPRLGIVAGVFADVALTPQLSLHPEVLYSQKGFKIVSDVDEGGVEGSLELTAEIDYLEVPVLLRYRLPVGQNGFNVGLEAGPTLAYKISTGTSIGCAGDEEFVDALCGDIEDPDDEDLDDEIRDFDFGLAGGLTVGAGPFAVGARYTHGLTSIDNSDEGDEVNAMNRVFSVTARYSFGG